MNLAAIDWLIVLALLASMAVVAVVTRRYTRSVSDFLAGNRCAGRYLLTMSEGLAALGLAGVIANFEKFYNAGFAASWWGYMMVPLGTVIALFGWVNYRYRETRAMTMAQFFEMRYSRRFRIFAGSLGFVSGVLNFGVFPGITARFLVYFCGLPESLDLLGYAVPTIAPVMLFMISVTLILTLAGGMVTVMICDFLQAQFINIVFLVVMFVLFYKFSWTDITTTLSQRPAGKSLVNPFDQSAIGDFDIWFFMIFAFKLFYNRLGWQGTQGYNCAAKSPHESRMAGVLAEWRNGVTYLIIMLMPICAYVLLHGTSHSAEAAAVDSTLSTIADPKIRSQVTTPLALVQLLPVGVVGLLCAAMIAGTVGNDTTYMHAWGSIFIQDVVLPLRGKPLTPRQHINLLRCSVLAVAVFSFFWSLFFPMKDYVIMYQLITGAVYLAGSGAVIIGGLYWSRGTTAGAWTALLTGASLAVAGIVGRTVWTSVPALASLSPEFPIGTKWVALIASLTSIVAYVVVSLLTCRQPFNMLKLLHRGPYADPSSGVAASAVMSSPTLSPTPKKSKLRLIGITTEFTRGDRAIYYLKTTWTSFWVLAFLAGTLLGLTVGIPDRLWLNWWLFTIVLSAVVGVLTTIWFVWGGTRDLLDLMRTLGSAKRDVTDDGSVHDSPATAPVVTPKPAVADAAPNLVTAK